MKGRTIASTFLAVLTLFVGVLFYPLKPTSEKPEKGAFAITDTNIINIETGAVEQHRTIFIKEGIISKIIASGDVKSLQGYQQINGKGKFVIPGLWDMHTHSLKISPQVHHPLYIAFGVTGVRDMSGCMVEDDSFWACIHDRKKWEEEALAGNRVSPRYVLQSSYQTDGGSEVPEGFPNFLRLDNPDDAQKLVKHYQAKGANFIKVHAQISEQKYTQLSEAMLNEKIALVGHKPLQISLQQAINAQQRSIEHGRLFLFECYKNIEEFRKLDDPIKHFDANLMRKLMSMSSSEQCESLMELMAASDTWWVPTLTTLYSASQALEEAALENPIYDFVPSAMKNLFWQPDLDKAKKTGYDDNGSFVHKDFFQMAQAHLKQASDNNVKILAGTDTLDSMIVAGYSLHHELKMMVEAGLSPLQAIQAATISPAKFSGLESMFGTVTQGKAADLLILNKNPLIDISNTQQINHVIFNGHSFDKQALDNLLQYAKSQADSIRVNTRFFTDAIKSPLIRAQLAD